LLTSSTSSSDVISYSYLIIVFIFTYSFLTISLNTTFFISLFSPRARDIALRFIVLDILVTIAGLVAYLALGFVAFSLGGYLVLGVLGNTILVVTFPRVNPKLEATILVFLALLFITVLSSFTPGGARFFIILRLFF